MFENIEKFYETNHYRLIEDKSEGSLRPGKSFTKDVEVCIGKFSEFYKNTGFTKLNEERLVSVIGSVDTNTRSQNLRVMREFGFLEELGSTDEEGMRFQFTDRFTEFVESDETPKEYIFNKLKSISAIEDLSMYLNLLICTLREAYLYGQVMLFRDSNDKFKSDVPDLSKRNEYRKRIYDVYGYSGRDNQVTDDVFSPNLSYMSRAELENLDLLIMTSGKIDNMNNLVLTMKGYELLCCIDSNLKCDTDEDNQKVNPHTGYTSKYSRNRILFGAPGTGKSFTLNRDRKDLLGESNETDYERVTFHPDYSYASFVGTYKPVPCKDDDGKDTITYEYVPGPFMRIYVEALKNGRTDNVKPYLLIIEEINRANVAAVFGDIFQLLDRENNISEYPITPSKDMREYLAKPEVLGGSPEDYPTIKIPDNMFIWATMNSADQGVFPMDTAFKRRWDFTYLGINDSDKKIRGKKVVLGKGAVNSRIVEWNELRKAINDELSDNKINEDKLIGPYFLSKSVVPESGEIDAETFINAFKSKVIMYLFEDAAKQRRDTIFAGCKNADKALRYSEICTEFEEKGVMIFSDNIKNKFNKRPAQAIVSEGVVAASLEKEEETE